MRSLMLNNGAASDPYYAFGYSSFSDDRGKQKKFTNLKWNAEGKTGYNSPLSEVRLVYEFDTKTDTKSNLQSEGHKDKYVAIYGDFHVGTEKLK